MADPISDIVNLTQAFGGFTQSLMQLNAARVSAESDRQTMALSGIRQSFLSRFNLPADDPARLTSDQDSWRPALEEYKAQVEQSFAGIKDPNIEAKVRRAFVESETEFQIGFEATLAKAELAETQEAGKITLAGYADMGDYGNVLAKLDEYEQQKLYSPAEMAELRRTYELPIMAAEKANGFYTASMPGTEIYKVNEAGEQVLDESGKPILMSAGDYAAAIEAAKADTTMGLELRTATVTSLENAWKAASARFMDEFKQRVINPNEEGELVPVAVAEEIMARAGRSLTPADRETMALATVDLWQDQTSANIDGYLEKLTFTTGRSLTRSGYMSAARELGGLYGEEAASDSVVLDKYMGALDEMQSWVKDGASREAMKMEFDSRFNELYKLYKTNSSLLPGGAPVSGADLMDLAFDYAGVLTDTEFVGLVKKIEEASYYDETDRALFAEDSGLVETLKTVLADPKIRAMAGAATMGTLIKDGKLDLTGKTPEAALAREVFSTIRNVAVARAAQGKLMTPTEIRDMTSKLFISSITALSDKARVFDAPALGTDAAYEERLAVIWDYRDADVPERSLDFLTGRSVLGTDVSSPVLSAVKDAVLPYAERLIKEKFPDAQFSDFTVISVGADLFFVKPGETKTAYSLDSVVGEDGKKRLVLGQYRVDTSQYEGYIDRALKRGGRSVATLIPAIPGAVAAPVARPAAGPASPTVEQKKLAEITSQAQTMLQNSRLYGSGRAPSVLSTDQAARWSGATDDEKLALLIEALRAQRK